MHGLINRSIQGFLRDSFGDALWSDVARAAALGFDGFEPMLHYDPAITDRVIAVAARRLDRPRDALLEDLGTYLVSHPAQEGVRRLLRFGGVDFPDFLASLEDLPGRARLAVPDLDLPDLSLEDEGPGRFTLTCRGGVPGVGHVLLGLLRAMADDYGSLVMLDHRGTDPDGAEVVGILLLDTAHAAARPFALAGPRGGEGGR